MTDERHAWLLEHIATCTACGDLYREDTSGQECPALAAFWKVEAP